MQITTAARRITRTVNTYTRDRGIWTNSEVYFDASGREVHLHASQITECDSCPSGEPGRYRVRVGRHPITYADTQEMIEHEEQRARALEQHQAHVW